MADIAKYLEDLKSPNPNKRFDACYYLRRMKEIPESGILALQEAIDDSDPLVAKEARNALAIAKNNQNPDVADAARRALEFHIPSATKSQIDKQPSQVNNNTNSGIKFLGGYLVFIVLILLICAIVSGGDELGLILAFAGGPLLIIALIVGGVGFFVSKTVENKKPQPSTNRTPHTETDDGNALEKFIEKIDFSKLTEKPEYYYKEGVAFIEKGQFDDGIIEFTKVINITSVEDDLYAFAQKELERMGFSKADIDGIRKHKTAQ